MERTGKGKFLFMPAAHNHCAGTPAGEFLPAAAKGMKNAGEHNVPHGKKPDVDNLLKAVMDAMTAVQVWKDDALVYATEVSKWYAGRKTGA